MSLLNDALSDLDLRDPSLKRGNKGLDNDVKQKKRPKLIRIIFFISGPIFLAAIITNQYFQMTSAGQSIMEPIVESIDPHSNEYKVNTHLLEKKLAFDNVDTSFENFMKGDGFYLNDANINIADDTANKKNRENTEIKKLLDKASRSIKDNQLTVPLNNNAMYFLSKASALSPGDKNVINKIKKVQALFLAQLEYAFSNNRLDIARKLVNRLSVVNVPDDQRHDYYTRLINAERNLVGEKITATNTKILAKPNKYDMAGSWMIATKTLQFKESQVLNEVKVLLDNNETESANERLYGFLSLHPDSLRVNIFAVDYYLNTDDVSNAKKYILNLSEKNTYKPYLSARLAYHEKNIKLAVYILESNPANEQIKFLHGALLAVLYQKQDKHERARTVYIDLLRLDSMNTQFLLGYAISSDALRDDGNSMIAYNKILKIGHSSSQVINFVEQRIATIENNTIVEAYPW